MNWNAFTLQFLKDSIASVRKDLSNEWPSGNLALLQVMYMKCTYNPYCI
jgi:hypothetical protein